MGPRGFVVLRGGTKLVALAAGFVVSGVSLLSAFGALTANGWARAGGAAVLMLAVPAALADRLLPKDPADAKGLTSDVFALAFTGFAVAFLAFASVTRPLLLREADREAREGVDSVARVTYFLAGASPVLAPTVADAKTSGSSSASPTAAALHGDGGIRPADAGFAQVDAARPTRTAAELFRELAPAVVNLSVKGEHGDGTGTGFLIDADGTLATAHHVIAGASEVRVKLLSGKWVENKDVVLLADNEPEDLALLRIQVKDVLKAVHLGDSEQVSVGEPVISIGNPLGLEHTLTDGLVSARRLYEGHAYIQMSAPVSPGNSGGPLFDMRGDVIGVTTQQVGGMFGRGQNLNLAVPVNVLRWMLASEYPKRRAFGKDDASTTSW